MHDLPDGGDREPVGRGGLIFCTCFVLQSVVSLAETFTLEIGSMYGMDNYTSRSLILDKRSH